MSPKNIKQHESGITDTLTQKMKRNPYFDRRTRSTQHSDYLDSVALFKLGQIDLRQLETALNDFN